MKKNFYILLFLLVVVSQISLRGATRTLFTSGNWNTAGSWVGGIIPGSLGTPDFVVIPAGLTCTVDVNTNVIDSIAVYGTLNFLSSNVSDLKYTYQFVIYPTGIVNNTGSIEKMQTGGNFIINGAGTYIHNPFNNVLLDESIFYWSSENFSSTSNVTINKWFDISIPVCDLNRVATSIFGNLTLSVNTTGLRWNQKGTFSNNRIKGTFTITDGIIQMDDGQGATTALTLQTVLINGTGSMIVRSGISAPFTFITGAFTDVSTSATPTVLADTTFCLFTWNASSNVQLSHNFYGMVGTASETGGDLRINITGNLSIGGTASCMFVSQCDAPLRLTVTGATTISGTPSKVRFVDGNNGLMNFITNDFVISGGTDNVLMGGGLPIVPKATGIPTVTINNDFLINAASNNYIVNADTNVQKLRLTVGRDFIMSNTASQLIVANHLGANTFKTSRHFSMNGGSFNGEMDTANVAVDSMIILGNFTFDSPVAANYCYLNAARGATIFQTTGNLSIPNSGMASGQGVYGVYNGSGSMTMTVGGNFVEGPAASQFNALYNNKAWLNVGNLTFTVTGMLDQNGGIFRGVSSPVNSNTSIINFTVNSVDFDGGYFTAYHTANNANGTVAFNITNNFKINFTAATDSFMLVGVPYVTPDFCYLTCNVTIGGSLLISGANGAFVSSFGKNGETYNITGNVTISAGRNAFNPAPPVVSTTHNVTMNVGGSMTFSGGTTYMSQLNDSLNLNVIGDMTIAGGTVSMKGKNGTGVINVQGGFDMTSGSLYLHNNAANSTSDGTTLTINSDGNAAGDFSHTGGIITFDNSALGNPAQPQTIIVKSPNYTIGGTGSMTRNGTNSIGYYGALRFQRNGTTNFSRTSNTHDIQQVRQYIDNGTTVDVVNGNMQIASWNMPFTLDLLNIMNTGTLALRGNSIKSNVTLGNSGITVYGRLALQHANGFYNNTAAAALDATGMMNYLLQVGSTVEYYGTANQTITGMNLGLATIGGLHKYYNLDINMGGTAYAFPTNNPTVNSTYVRHHLNLLGGELNLDNDHVTANGGRSIIIEDSTTAAISQASGFIRSETEDGSGLLRWNIGRALGPHIVPFGYTLAVADRIPFIFEIPSGDVDTVSISTYHTNPLNIPYPPTCTHVRNNSGVDNSSNTVDRFWSITQTGTNANANMTFSVLSAGSTVNEMLGINTLRAQRWIPGLVSWEFPYQGVQTNPIGNGTLVTGATSLLTWWTLSGNSSPLPVQMLSFSGNCDGKNTSLNWTTASEINNDHFNVLRSTDGVNYESLGIVAGNGNSTTNISYKFVDINSLPELSYYKLIQTDYDGHSEEFGPLIIKSCLKNPGLDVVVSSSDAGNTNLMIVSPYSGNFHVDILNSQGQEILSIETFIPEGSSLVPLATDKLSSGIYHIRLQSEKDAISKKVFINKN
ncbi:MAG: hypothetical protein ABI763_12500 [Bacteroidota bacterium]